MMVSKYILLFRIEVLHSYFENNTCTCLQFNPDSVTMGMLKRFGFTVRSKTNGFELYTNTTRPLHDLFEYITQVTGQDFFDFQMVTTNPDFTQFTDLASDWMGQMLFDSSNSSNIFSNGTVTLAPTLLATQDTSAVGNLKIRFSDLVKYVNENATVVLSMQFNARETQWQYYVVNKSAVQLENPSISGKTGVSFTGPENVTIASGQPALFFSSGSTLLPLSEKPKQKLDLVSNPAANADAAAKKKTSAKIIFKGLPNPGSKNIGIVTVNGAPQVSSPMYVFV